MQRNMSRVIPPNTVSRKRECTVRAHDHEVTADMAICDSTTSANEEPLTTSVSELAWSPW